MLILKNAIIGYQTPLILEVNLSLELGEVCLVLGSNGVGKTTLIKSILGQISLLGGHIFLQGKEVKEHSSQRDCKASLSGVF